LGWCWRQNGPIGGALGAGNRHGDKKLRGGKRHQGPGNPAVTPPSPWPSGLQGFLENSAYKSPPIRDPARLGFQERFAFMQT